MIRLFLMTLVSAVGLASTAMAQDMGPKASVKVKLDRAYVPQGFDNNDVTKIVIEGTFPNTCYKMGRNSARVDAKTNTIYVMQTAYVYNKMCLMMLVPFSETVEVGLVRRAGRYIIRDAATNKALGAMPVARSKTQSPDDHFYANISDSYVTRVERGRKVIVLRGYLPGNCWVLTEKKVVLEGRNVVTVLPIMQYDADDMCIRRPVPFTTTVNIPNLRRGRYLLNVRSLNGKAINRLFDVH